MIEIILGVIFLAVGMGMFIFVIIALSAILFNASRGAYRLTAIYVKTSIARTVERRREIQRVDGSLSMPKEDTQGAVSIQNERGAVHVVETPE